MKLRIRRRHVFITVILLAAFLLIAFEVFQLSPGARRAYLQFVANQEAYDSVSGFLDDEDARVCGDAQMALAKAGVPAVPALTRRLSDPSDTRRRLAATVLGRIGSPAKDSLPELMNRIKNDGNEFVRSNCATAYGLIGKGDSALIDELIGMLETGDDGLRPHAAEALGNIGSDSERVVVVLEKALKQDPVAKVRAEAAEAIGNLGAVSLAAIPALIDAMNNDADKNVRKEAAGALKELVQSMAVKDPEQRTKIEAAVRQATKSFRPL